MTEEQDIRLRTFAAEYGRLCAMTARALTQGHAYTQVMVSAQGNGFSVLPVYAGLRGQRARVDELVNLAYHVGVSLRELVEVGKSARGVVEAEWMVDLPSFHREVAV